MLADLVRGLLPHRRSVRKRHTTQPASAEALEQRTMLTVTFKFDYRLRHTELLHIRRKVHPRTRRWHS